MDIVLQNQQTVQCEVMTENGQNIQPSGGHSDTHPTYGTVLSTERRLTECTM